MVVYLPVLTLTGVEGKMFIPMALTVVMALVGAIIFSITFIPAAVAIFLSKDVSEKELPLIQFIKKMYGPSLNWSLRHHKIVIIPAVLLVLLTGFLATRMGREFVPSLDEGD